MLDRRFAGAVTFYRLESAVGEILVQAAADAASTGDVVAVRPTAPVQAFPAEP